VTDPAVEAVAETKQGNGDPALLLFTTKTCPNCKLAKHFLDKAGIEYKVMLAEESMDLVNKLGIKQTPTLVIQDGDSADKIVNLSNIRKFTEESVG